MKTIARVGKRPLRTFYRSVIAALVALMISLGLATPSQAWVINDGVGRYGGVSGLPSVIFGDRAYWNAFAIYTNTTSTISRSSAYAGTQRISYQWVVLTWVNGRWAVATRTDLRSVNVGSGGTVQVAPTTIMPTPASGGTSGYLMLNLAVVWQNASTGAVLGGLSVQPSGNDNKCQITRRDCTNYGAYVYIR